MMSRLCFAIRLAEAGDVSQQHGLAEGSSTVVARDVALTSAVRMNVMRSGTNVGLDVSSSFDDLVERDVGSNGQWRRSSVTSLERRHR